jgi:hypothetical protein
MKSTLSQCFLTICFAITFLFSPAAETNAQFDSLGLNTEWRKGSILRDDNSALEGLIQFNDKLGMIKYKKNPDSEERSFTEKSIVAMKLFDDKTSAWQNFAVFNVKEESTGLQAALLFEVLMEFKKFALLTRVERVNVAVRMRQDAFGYGHYHEKVGHEQFEKLCLVNDDGNATVALSVSEFERKKLSLGSKVKPQLNRQALEKYLADDWEKFNALVKSNKLNLKKRADFIRAFEYYRQVIQEGS